VDKNEEFWKFADSERHFNETQAGIRQHAATWMLAAFAAIALLLKSEGGVDWLLSPAVLVGVVSMMATLGLVNLWINDQLVYQRLLDSGFIIALKREYDDPGVPPIRSMMMYSAEGKGMARWMTYFYTIPMWGFLGITVIATIVRRSIGRGSDGDRALAILAVICAAQLFATIWVHRKKAEVGAYTRATLFGDSEFASMFDGTPEARARFAAIIARHRPYRGTNQISREVVTHDRKEID
jgi:hypothetical protein